MVRGCAENKHYGNIHLECIRLLCKAESDTPFQQFLMRGFFLGYHYITHSFLVYSDSMFSVTLFIHIPCKPIYFCYSFFC